MIPSARLAAAIEVVADIEARRRPAVDALKDWGLNHRFAGSSDRAAIAGLVYDALRRKSSSAWIAGNNSPRGVLLGMLRQERGLSVDEVEKLCSGARFSPPPLTAAEQASLSAHNLAGAPAPVLGDYPEWLDPYFSRVFGDDRAAEGAALARRAPLDLRVNTLRCERDEARPKLEDLHAEPTQWSPIGLRIRLAADAKNPALHAEPAFRKGMVEIQDEASQLAALFAGAKPGEQVVDLAAGAGGKTLALAAAMENQGQIYAADPDAHRLAPIFARLARSGARNVQVRAPRGQTDVLADLEGRCDLVLIDAPCTGSGAWRRNPDAKWRIRPGALEQRIKDQDETLDSALRFVKQGGRIVYITCSVLRAENEDRIAAFMARHDDLLPIDANAQANSAGLPALAQHQSTLGPGLRLSPKTTGTDGFYIATLTRT